LQFVAEILDLAYVIVDFVKLCRVHAKDGLSCIAQDIEDLGVCEVLYLKGELVCRHSVLKQLVAPLTPVAISFVCDLLLANLTG